MPVPDINPDKFTRYKKEIKHNVRYSGDDRDFQNSFLPKPIIRQEYGTLFEH